MNCYLDYNASAPARPEVIDAVSEAMASATGNPSSMHGFGRRAGALLTDARERIAAALDAEPRQVVFTSGATESNNLAIRGRASLDPERVLLAPATEHVSVLNTLKALDELGHRVEILSVDADCRPALTSLPEHCRGAGCLLALGHANGETGHVVDVSSVMAELDEACLVHIDASQSLGRVPVSFRRGIDSLAFAGHKLGGPLGVGGLLVRRPAEFAPLMSGGSHEGGLRPGTENVAGASGLAVAVELACREREEEMRRLRDLREALWQQLCDALSGIRRITPDDGLANTLTFAVREPGSDVLIAGLDMAGYCVSSGSACAAGSPEVSHVIKALGVPDAYSRGVIRVSMGKATQTSDVSGFGRALVDVVERARRAA